MSERQIPGYAEIDLDILAEDGELNAVYINGTDIDILPFLDVAVIAQLELQAIEYQTCEAEAREEAKADYLMGVAEDKRLESMRGE